MAFGQGYLGEIGSRLQRLLGFDGDAGASFTAQAVPVMLVGDATEPGYGSNQGRRFQHMNGVSSGGYLYIRATADLIITKISAQLTNAGAGGTLTWDLVAPGTADPGSLPAGIFLDRSLSSNDTPQIKAVSNATPTTGKRLVTLNVPAGAAIGSYWTLCDQPFCLSVGQAVVFAAAGLNFNIETWGRTL